MKKFIIGLALIIAMIPSANVLATEEVPGAENVIDSHEETGIVLDGLFDDWEDKPSVKDKSGDSGSNGTQDLKELRFYADEEYLYLYIERYKSAQGWDLWVPIINGTGYEESIFMPWEHGNLEENKDEGWKWKSDKVSTFKINVDYSSWNRNSLAVKPQIGGKSIGEDMTYFNTDGTKFEIRLPLDLVGLKGVNKEIKFSVASDISQYAPTSIDWIKDDGPIVITQGPIFGALTPMVALLGFAGVGVIATKRK